MLTDKDLSTTQIMGVGHVAAALGIQPGTLYMRRKRGTLDFPEPHAKLGGCLVWLRTVEVDAAIAAHQSA